MRERGESGEEGIMNMDLGLGVVMYSKNCKEVPRLSIFSLRLPKQGLTVQMLNKISPY